MSDLFVSYLWAKESSFDHYCKFNYNIYCLTKLMSDFNACSLYSEQEPKSIYYDRKSGEFILSEDANVGIGLTSE